MGSVKTDWTWEEWQESRQARREVSARVAPGSVRRKESSSDSKLRKAFDGERGPPFQGDTGLGVAKQGAVK
jgi:hypothetical protein